MSTNPLASLRDEWSGKAAETAIRLGVLAILLVWCFQILQPFILPFLWAVIIAVAIYPLYVSLVNVLQGRTAIAAALITVGFLVILMVPTVMLTKHLVANVAALADGIRQGRIEIPPPPDAVRAWPLIGDAVANAWNLVLTNFVEALRLVEPQLKVLGLWLLSVAAKAGVGLLVFVAAFVIAGILLANSAQGHRLAYRVSRRLVGERGDKFADLAGATIRSVARGVLGVAVIQALLAGLGFMAAGVPGAGIWALLCLISAVVQIGVGPIVIPVVIYVFVTGDTVIAVVFLVWNALIMVLDNILKPLLIGRGVDVPMIVIFVGAIGGMLLSGIIGLFIGAIVLALGYKLFQAWLAAQPDGDEDTPVE
ncbi:MAG: AI-2E family transporter [Gammaproteobacteria bacterium]|nr:AI-2E family transporter [Gammaproteobacteria bacterium]